MNTPDQSVKSILIIAIEQASKRHNPKFELVKAIPSEWEKLFFQLLTDRAIADPRLFNRIKPRLLRHRPDFANKVKTIATLL